MLLRVFGRHKDMLEVFLMWLIISKCFYQSPSILDHFG